MPGSEYNFGAEGKKIEVNLKKRRRYYLASEPKLFDNTIGVVVRNLVTKPFYCGLDFRIRVNIYVIDI